MNRKIQDSDTLFIVARYKRDPYAFSARGEAEKYEVSIVTIYNVLSKAGVKMRRGRKPLLAPPAPLISPEPPPVKGVDDETFARIEAARAAIRLDPPSFFPNTSDYLRPPVGPKPPLTPKPPITPRKGPPVIRPNAG